MLIYTLGYINMICFRISEVSLFRPPVILEATTRP